MQENTSPFGLAHITTDNTSQMTSETMSGWEVDVWGGGSAPNSTVPLPIAPPAPPGVHAAMAVVLLTACVVGTVANSLILVLFRRDRRLRSLTNMYVVALSCSELLMSVLGVSMAGVSSSQGAWVFGQAGCSWHAFLTTWLGLADLNLLTAIAVDRYILIVKPALRVRMTSRPVKLTITLCLAVPLLWAVLPLVGGVSSYTYEGLGTSCSLNWAGQNTEDRIYVIWIFLVFFAVPVITICTVYTIIFLKIRNLNKNNSLANSSSLAARNARIERKAAVTFALTVAAFLVSWTPYAAVSLMVVSGHSNSLSLLAKSLPAVFAKASVIWNPLIYVGSNRVFRQYFLELYLPGPTHDQHNASTEDTSPYPQRIRVGDDREVEVVPMNKVGVAPDGRGVRQGDSVDEHSCCVQADLSSGAGERVYVLPVPVGKRHGSQAWAETSAVTRSSIGGTSELMSLEVPVGPGNCGTKLKGRHHVAQWSYRSKLFKPN